MIIAIENVVNDDKNHIDPEFTVKTSASVQCVKIPAADLCAK